MVEWFEDERYWSTWYPYMFGQERLDAAENEVEQLLALVNVEGGKVLDLACGPGRHAVELAKRGFQVTGVDRSPFLLSKARERAEEASVTVEWVEADMREFERPGEFDLVINMFTAFGYFDDKAEDVQVLKKIHGNLAPNGLLLIDTIGKERLAKIFLETSSNRTEDGALVVYRREIFDDWTRIRNEWLLIKDGNVETFEFHHTVYSGQELRDRLEGTGFSEVALYGGLDKSPYDIDAERLIALARR